MPTNLLSVDAVDAIEQAAAVLTGGGLVVFPTDTVYGLAVAARVPGATSRIFAAKDRPGGQALAVLVADTTQAEELAALDAPPGLAALLEEAWPGPLTVVLGRRPSVA